MWLVWLALRRPYTFVVMAMVIVLLGGYTAFKMPVDMFPEINIPVVSIIWNYTGISADDMEKRIVFNCERALGTLVNNIEHVESTSLLGVGVVKVYFHEGTQMPAATAEVTAICQTIIRAMPPGMTPPLIIRYSASNVPILLASVSSDTLSETQLFDIGFNVFRLGLTTVEGAQMPYPYGGKQRAVMIDLDPARLASFGLSANDVSTALAAQSLILPSGDVRVGTNDYSITTNSSPRAVSDFNAIPLSTRGDTTVYLKDVAFVHDGYLPQASMAHIDGKRGVLMPILKSQGSSTISVVSRVRAALPALMQTLPKDFHVDWFIDQSVFVWSAIDGVILEAAIAAFLTGLMILLFLGSWRSTLVTVISIPLSIMVSIIVLGALGESLNIMTLGGLALAVGILVDDATVTIENVHRNLGMGKPLIQGIVDGAQQIAVPALVSTLCICIVFLPVVNVTGPARHLFIPLAMSVVFAMLTSYFLSRTLVPTLIQFLLPAEIGIYRSAPDHATEAGPGPAIRGLTGLIWGVHQRFNRGFEAVRQAYGRTLALALGHRGLATLFFALLVGSGLALMPFIGRDFFPTVDAGQLRLHVRCPPGTRIEQNERYIGRFADLIRRDIPPVDLKSIIDSLGIPNSGINLSLGDPSMISQADGEIMITLKPGHRHPSDFYMRRLRADFAAQFPGFTMFSLPADISSQILNFGISAPIDIQVSGPSSTADGDEKVAREILAQVAAIPGAVDVHLHQVPRAPALGVEVDRTLAGQAGLSQTAVAGSLLTTLSSSAQTSPQFWLDPLRGVQYSVYLEAPIYREQNLQNLADMPVGVIQGGAQGQQLLGSVADIRRTALGVGKTHYDVQTSFDVLANVDGTDLSSVANRVDRIVAAELASGHVPRGSQLRVRGQVQSMKSSFKGLEWGILAAVVLVYLLMAVNFQSWIDPVIILGALPGALSGILWMLFLTHTHLSVPALMGAIMSIGVATANSILVVSFANDQRTAGGDAMASGPAALLAGMTRLRPVVMTALAMVLGMLPMSLGLGDGGEQNAPLARAVIGGLILATLTTLFFVPVLYSRMRTTPPRKKIPLADHSLGEEAAHA